MGEQSQIERVSTYVVDTVSSSLHVTYQVSRQILVYDSRSPF